MVQQITFLAVGLLMAISANGQYSGETSNADTTSPIINLLNRETHPDTYSNKSLKKKRNHSATQQLDSIIYYGYDEASKEWSRKIHGKRFFYDNNFNDTLMIHSTWDSKSNMWSQIAKIIKKYDAHNRLSLYETYYPSIKGNRLQYTYNNNGDLTEMSESFLRSGIWLYKQKHTYTYNSDNQLQTDTLFNRYSISGKAVWKKTGITRFYYTPEGKSLVDTAFIKQWPNSDWKLFSKTTQEYNSTKKSKETTFFRWKDLSKAFNPISKKTTLYHNIDSDISAIHDFKWNKEHSRWDTTNINQFTYSIDDYIIALEQKSWGDTPSQVLHKFDFNYSVTNHQILLPSAAIIGIPKKIFHHQILKSHTKNYDNTTKAYKKTQEVRYFYSDINTGPITTVNNTPHVAVKVYPNPANELIKISYPEPHSNARFELFSLHGNKMLSKIIQSYETVNISNLKPGLYFYSIQLGTQIHTGKLIIK